MLKNQFKSRFSEQAIIKKAINENENSLSIIFDSFICLPISL